jgi:outer membrane murein-binding lipoprotein Lpp
MDGITITAVISAAAAISGIVLGWLGRSRTVRQDGAEDGELRASVEYIARGVDDLRVEIRSQGQRYDMLAERVTRVEESAKQAHRRIDRLENEGRG